MEVVEVGSLDSLHALAPEWRALLDVAGDWDLFQTYEWQVTWLETFWPGRPVAFLFVKDGTQLAAVLPLLVAEEGEPWCRPSVVSPVNPHASRSGIAVRDDVPASLDALLSYVRRRAQGARLSLRQIDVAGGAAGIEGVVRRHGMAAFSSNRKAVPTIVMEGAWDAYVRQRSDNVRREMPRKEKRLAKAGRMDIRASEGLRDLEGATEAVLAVERGSWKHLNGSSLVNEPGLGDFYPTLVRRFGARGQCRVYVLWLDGSPLAHVTGILIRGRFFALKMSFVEASRKLSPGAVLFWNVIRDGFERGWTELDFLGDAMRWKAELGNGTKVRADLHAFPAFDPACQASRFLEERVKPAARRVLGLVHRLRARGGASDARTDDRQPAIVTEEHA